MTYFLQISLNKSSLYIYIYVYIYIYMYIYIYFNLSFFSKAFRPNYQNCIFHFENAFKLYMDEI